MKSGILPSHMIGRFSWLLPCSAAALVGILFQIPGAKLADHNVLILMMVAVGCGILATAARWLGLAGLPGSDRLAKVWPGLIANGSALLLLLLGMWAGEANVTETRAAADKQRASINQAQTQFPGWFGTWQGPAGRLMLMEVAPQSDVAHVVSKSFQSAFRVFMLNAEANPTSGGLTVSVQGTRIRMKDGQWIEQPNRAAILDSALVNKDEGKAMHGEPYRLPPGGSLGSGMVFLPADLASEQVASVELQINGIATPVAGRYLTAAEKSRLFQ